MARLCGILKIAPREDDSMCLLRLTREDVEGETVNGSTIEPGLYHASRDALERFGPKVLARLKREKAVPADATLGSIDPRMFA